MTEKKEINVEIGRRIKLAREKIGYTQEKFAEKIDRSVQYVSDLERGKVGASIQTLINICKTLYVTTDFILLGKEEKEQGIPDIFEIPPRLTNEQIEIVRESINIVLKAFNLK